MSFGFFIRGLTGLASKKQCIKMATNTGKELVDLMQSTGRNLTKADIDSVFERTLPKGFAPKVLTEREDLIPYFIKQGMSEETARAYANHPNIGAATIFDGSKKSVLFLPLLEDGTTPLGREIALYSHELEHALEGSHRLKMVILRKFSETLRNILKKIKPNYLDDTGNIAMRFHNFEGDIQLANNTAMDYTPRFLDCNATKEGILQLNGMDENKYIAQFKDIIRHFADSSSKGSKNRLTFKTYIEKLKLEVSAYKTEGDVQAYASKIGEGQISAATGTSIIYKDTIKLLRKEKWNYIKNLFRGKLNKPTVYQTDKDLFNLFDNPADKELIKKYITGLNYQHKQNVFNVLSKNPDRLNTYVDFIKAVKQAGSRFSYRAHLCCLENMSDEAMKNPDIIKIAGIGKDVPEYAYCLENIAKAKPERIADFAQIAGEQSAGGIYKYHNLVNRLDHPEYETLKKIASIETPSSKGLLIGDIIGDVSCLESAQIKEIYEVASRGEIDTAFKLFEDFQKAFVEGLKTKIGQQPPKAI